MCQFNALFPARKKILNKLFTTCKEQSVHKSNFETCYFIKGKEAILVLFRQGVCFSRVPGTTLPNMITIFRYFDNVLICLKNVPRFLSLPQRRHKMHLFRELKSANSLLMLIIYKPASGHPF